MVDYPVKIPQPSNSLTFSKLKSSLFIVFSQNRW